MPGRRPQSLPLLLGLTAVCLACDPSLPGAGTDAALRWGAPEAVAEAFAKHGQNRFALWIELINRASAQRPVRIAEIGVWEGDFAEQILRNCPNVERYYLVDPWRHLSDWRKPLNVSNVRFEQALEKTLRRLEFAGDRIVVLRGTTLEVSEQVQDGELDFVYIDGDHTAKGITIDLIRWYPKLAQGGLLGGDDFVDDIYHHDRRRFDPTMVKPVVSGFVAGHRIEPFFHNATQFGFFR